MSEIEVDVSFCSTKASLHELFASVLKFPGYYGMNWDAFRDCINDSEQSNYPDTITIIGIDYLKQKMPNDANILIELLDELQSRNNAKKVYYKYIENEEESISRYNEYINKAKLRTLQYIYFEKRIYDEYETRLGCTRMEIENILENWCKLNKSNEICISNCINEICNGLVIDNIKWNQWFDIDQIEYKRILVEMENA